MLQRVPEVVRMLGSLMPKSQRVPVNVEVRAACPRRTLALWRTDPMRLFLVAFSFVLKKLRVAFFDFVIGPCPRTALCSSQATSNALPYSWDVLSSSHVTPVIVGKAFHSAGVGLRHLGYAAHLAAFNNSHPFLAALFEKMIVARCCKVLLRTKLLQHISDHSDNGEGSDSLPPRRHGGFSGVAVDEEDTPSPAAEEEVDDNGDAAAAPNDDGAWESLDEDFEVGIERVPAAAPGTPPAGGSASESHTPCDSGAPTPRVKDSELRRSTQVRGLRCMRRRRMG